MDTCARVILIFLFLPSPPCHHCPKLHLVTSHYCSDSSLNCVVCLHERCYQDQDQLATGHPCPDLLATPHFTDSVRQKHPASHIHIDTMLSHHSFYNTQSLGPSVIQHASISSLKRNLQKIWKIIVCSWGLFVLCFHPSMFTIPLHTILEPIIGTLPRLFASQTPQYHTGSRRIFIQLLACSILYS